MLVINICKDFTETPGGRYKKEGPFSGEEFRDRILEPKYNAATEQHDKLCIMLDGGYGYLTSFLEEAFGGLARKYGQRILDTIEFVSEEEPGLVEEIQDYIIKAKPVS